MTIDDLKTQLQTRHGKVKNANGSWLRIPCPTCTGKDRKKMKRYVSTTGNHSHCFICKVRLDYNDLLGPNAVVGNIEFEKVVHEEEKTPDPRCFELPCYSSIPVDQLPLDHPAVQFLHKDHLFDLKRYAEEHHIVYCPLDGGKSIQSAPFITSSERLIFPVYFQGSMVGWQLRTVPGTFYGDREGAIKYYHLFNKGSYLYNYDNAKAANPELVIVVEGVKKALKFPNAVATFGTGITPKQHQLIREWKNIIVMMDAEDHNGTQQMAKTMVAALNFDGHCAINIDLRKYGAISPDDLPEDVLMKIVYYEWMEHGKKKAEQK